MTATERYFLVRAALYASVRRGPVSRPGTRYARSRAEVPPRWIPLWDAVADEVTLPQVFELGRGAAAQVAAQGAGASNASFGLSGHSWFDAAGPLAVDCYLVGPSGLLAVPDLQGIAADLGLVSGRTWRRPDPPHVQVGDWIPRAVVAFFDWLDSGSLPL